MNALLAIVIVALGTWVSADAVSTPGHQSAQAIAGGAAISLGLLAFFKGDIG